MKLFNIIMIILVIASLVTVTALDLFSKPEQVEEQVIINETNYTRGLTEINCDEINNPAIDLFCINFIKLDRLDKKKYNSELMEKEIKLKVGDDCYGQC